MQGAPFPYGAFDAEEFVVAVDGDSVGCVGLQFDRVSARGVSGFENFNGSIEILAMVGAHFGDDENRAVRGKKICSVIVVTYSIQIGVVPFSTKPSA